MNSPIKTLCLAAFVVTTAVLGVLVFQQRKQLDALRQSAAALTAERDAAKKSLSQSEQRLAASEKARTDLEAAAKNASVARPAIAPAVPARDPAAALAAIDSPAMQRVMAASMKASLDQRYGALFKKLKLSPEALDKFKDLLTEKQMTALDVMRASQTQGLNLRTDEKQINTIMAKMQAEADNGIRTFLGDESFRQFEDFNQNSASYGLIDQIERRLSFTNAPLQGAQSEALLRVLRESPEFNTSAVTGSSANATSGFIQGLAGNSALGAMNQPQITDRTLAAAQGVLSAPQIEVFRQLQAEQQKQRDTMESLRSQGRAAGRISPEPLPSATRPTSP